MFSKTNKPRTLRNLITSRVHALTLTHTHALAPPAALYLCADMLLQSARGRETSDFKRKKNLDQQGGGKLALC